MYALTGVVAGRAGMAAPVAFGFAALLASLTALSFGELSGRFPRAGGEAVYVAEGFGHRWMATGVGLLVTLAGTVSAATVSVAFVGHLSELVALPHALGVLLVVLGVGAIAAWGVGQVVLAAGLMTILEVGGLLLVVAWAGDAWSTLPARAPELWPGLDAAAWSGAMGAALVAFYAFLGFEDMVNVAEEVVDVRRTLPHAILITLVATLVLYLTVSTAAVLVVDPDELARSDAPLVLVFARSGGSPAVLTGIALFAMLNGALIQVVKASRVLYGLASLGSIPEVFARVNRRTRTPLLATGCATGIAAGMALTFPLHQLASLTSSVTLVTFALANLALVLVKRRGPPPPTVWSVPLMIPVAGCVLSLAFVGFALAR